MTEEEMLFAAIRANPDEDTPRLAYADWLDEHVGDRTPTGAKSRTGRRKFATGSEQAEYIRLSCELARLREADPSPATMARIKELKAREKELERPVRRAWELPFQNGKPFFQVPEQLIGIAGFGFGFDRGLPSGSYLPIADVLNYGESILRQSPAYSFNLHTTTAPLLTQLLASPWLRHLPQLWIQSANSEEGHEPPDFSQFADSPYSEGLTALGMSSTWSLTPTGAVRLAGSPSLRNLRSLSLYQLAAGASGFTRLFQGVAFRGLTQLHLGVPLTRRELAAIFGSSALATLEELYLSESINKTEGKALARSPMWPNLRNLQLVNMKGGGAQALASAPASRLETLTLYMSDFADQQAGWVARWPIWQSLRTLDLEGTTDLSHTGWGELIRAMSTGSIRNLNLSRCSVDDQVVKQIADASHMAEIRTLKLTNTPLTDVGVLALAGSASLSRLRDLRLDGCQISPGARRKLKKRFGAAVQFKPVDDD